MIETETETENKNCIKPRNVLLLSLDLLNIIPENQTELYNDINNLIKNDFFYKDEDQLKTPYNWKKLQTIMYKHIPIVDEKWKEKVVDVYIGK
jgi:hypothetical protein